MDYFAKKNKKIKQKAEFILRFIVSKSRNHISLGFVRGVCLFLSLCTVLTDASQRSSFHYCRGVHIFLFHHSTFMATCVAPCDAKWLV